MKQTIFFFFGLNLIADLEAVVNSSWFWHQPSFYAQQFFLSCYGFCTEKDLSGQTASIHSFSGIPCVSRKSRQSRWERCVVQPRSPLGGGGGEDLLSQLLKCCWHQLSAASPFRDCLSYSEAVLARAEL